MNDAMLAETVSIAGHGGDRIEAYLARPLGPGPYGGVVVIHHMPGYDAGSKEITRTFAAHGYLAICPNLHYREAPGASPDDAAAASRAQGGVPLDAAVDCYGAFVIGAPPEGMPLKVGPIIHLAKHLSCPLLGLFGADDSHPSPDEVAELDKVLTDLEKPHEFHSYGGAGHAFFSVNRPAYRPEAATDGWQKIWDFYGRYLAS
jgi:carboxymethylenebutenolidase